MLNNIPKVLERALFVSPRLIVLLFVAFTGLMVTQALNLKMDAAFTKNIPLQHPYMQTYLKHEQQFGGANSIMVAVRDNSGDIYNPEFFEVLKNVHDELFFIPGVNRSQVKSLFSPSTRFTEVVADGFAGGPVIPANFAGQQSDLDVVRENVEKAGLVGRLVSNDYASALVRAQLMEFDPSTGEPLDTLAFASQLEQQIRAKFQSEAVSIHIIGFAKMSGDVADGAKDVIGFFAIAIAITALMVFVFIRSFALTLLPLLTSLMAVIWQLGMLTVLGFGLDPMSILVPFLVFAIGVSHGVQMINGISRRVGVGFTPNVAARRAFLALLVPGGVALLSDTVGFLTLLTIEIGIIRELAISASVGVGFIILTNLVLLPVVLSMMNIKPREDLEPSPLWAQLAKLTGPKSSVLVIAVFSGLFLLSYQGSKNMKIGDLTPGAPALHQDSVYNLDTKYISENYEITTDVISVIVEATPEACTYHDVVTTMAEFEWLVSNTTGVQSSASLASVAKQVNAGFNEGNPKWQTLPRTTASLVQAIGRVPTTSGLLDSKCEVMPIYFFLEDHKAPTIERVIEAIKVQAERLNRDDLQFKLASGPVGVMAATNEAVSAAQVPMMWYVYSVVSLLCLLSFRSIRATIVVVLPLYIVSTMAQALMGQLEIGLAVATLPVIALGVGIGVDYGIYILSTMLQKLRAGESVPDAYHHALVERGSAVIFTGITLAVGVSTWAFSALKFQVDMGLLLTFMFSLNMLGAIIMIPALCHFFWPKNR
ncbi:RND family transporter [Paraferrimonas sp. SM1919]|uniref:efflux RND transporter permease subunit n=1 Tax=Paraferrimonas sp. SM1919 TaxID=2662263 RepID=UPI0013D0F474|nr:MMPL family transporter [Paraferrimonas sp. SM1919]